jgi:hypothetical protein
MGSCLDEVNARYLAEHRNQFPRLMTSAQASIFMARLRAGETVRRMTSGSKKIGKAKRSPASWTLAKLKHNLKSQRFTG